jgi:hypothetical protein
MPLTMMDAVRRGGAASSTDSSRGSRSMEAFKSNPDHVTPVLFLKVNSGN